MTYKVLSYFPLIIYNKTNLYLCDNILKYYALFIYQCQLTNYRLIYICYNDIMDLNHLRGDSIEKNERKQHRDSKRSSE